MDIQKIGGLCKQLEFHSTQAGRYLILFNRTKCGEIPIYHGSKDDRLKYLQRRCERHQKNAFEIMAEISALLPENLR